MSQGGRWDGSGIRRREKCRSQLAILLVDQLAVGGERLAEGTGLGLERGFLLLIIEDQVPGGRFGLVESLESESVSARLRLFPMAASAMAFSSSGMSSLKIIRRFSVPAVSPKRKKPLAGTVWIPFFSAWLSELASRLRKRTEYLLEAILASQLGVTV